jgi:hypothetical protein
LEWEHECNHMNLDLRFRRISRNAMTGETFTSGPAVSKRTKGELA